MLMFGEMVRRRAGVVGGSLPAFDNRLKNKRGGSNRVYNVLRPIL
jgi:hypothetical protein